MRATRWIASLSTVAALAFVGCAAEPTAPPVDGGPVESESDATKSETPPEQAEDALAASGWIAPLWTKSECEEFKEAFAESKIRYQREIEAAGGDGHNPIEESDEIRAEAAEQLIVSNRLAEALEIEGIDPHDYFADVVRISKNVYDGGMQEWAFKLWQENEGNVLTTIPQITDMGAASVGFMGWPSLWDPLDAFPCD